MFDRRSFLGISTALGVILTGSLGLAAFGMPPSLGDGRSGLLHAGEPPGSTGRVTATPDSGERLADVVARVKPAVVSVTSTYAETTQPVVMPPNAGRSPDAGEPHGPEALVPRRPDAVAPRRADAMAPRRTDAVAPRRTDAVVPRRTDAVVPHRTDAVVPRRLVTSHGAGFFISADGYAVTNHHVVESSRTVELATDDGTTYRANVIATDTASDLALLKVDGRNDFPFVRFAKKSPRVGERVFAVGNPFGLGGTVTAGIVSALDRNIGEDSYDGLIQIDAPINRGNSGGPCFDLNGEVIGVNTIIFSPSGGSVGIGFAIPAEMVSRVASDLAARHAVARGWLGVRMQPVTLGIAEALGLKEARGAIVTDTKTDAPGAQAGLAPADVIVSINGEPIRDNFDVLRKLDRLAPGTAIDLGIIHNGTETTLIVTLGETPLPRAPQGAVAAASHKPVPRTASDLGIALAPADQAPGNEKNGVVVVGMDPVGRAAGLGIGPGDVILEVSGRPVRTANEVTEALHNAHNAGRPAALMRLRSGDKMRFVAVPFDPA